MTESKLVITEKPKNRETEKRKNGKTEKQKISLVSFYVFWFFSFLVFLLNFGFCYLSFAEEKSSSSQELKDFSLVQYEEGGEKSWELSGKEAKIEDTRVKIDEVSAVSFGQDSALKLKAKTGNLDRGEDCVRLQEGVVIKSTDGTSLTTEYLDWEKDKKSVSTDADVEIRKSNFQVEGKGATFDLEEKEAKLEGDIKANFDSQGVPYLRTTNDPSTKFIPSEVEGLGSGERPLDFARGRRTTITCDGPLELNYKKCRATFRKNVLVIDPQGKIYADRIDVHFNPDTKRVKCIVARGNVRIFNGDSVTYSQKAIYLVSEGRVILPSRPKLVINRDESFDETFKE